MYKRIMTIMKKLFALLSVVLVAVSCSKDIDTNIEFAAGEGAMRFGIATQSALDADDSVVIKIYKVENKEQKLIRRYDAVADVPEVLALLAGDYVAKVQVGEKSAISFDKKYYYGEQSFNVTKGIVTPVTVDCKLQSTIVRVEYDATIAQNFSEGYFTTVAIAESYDAAAISTGDVLSLTYTETKEGYVIMPEGQTSLFWHFEGTHPAEGKIMKEALIANVKPSARYTIRLKYSKDAPGGLVINAIVDETLDERNDTIVFSPDPTVLGADFDITEEQLSTIASRVYNISSLAPISVMTMSIDGQEYNLLSETPAGVTLNMIDEVTYTLTVADTFFATVAGGKQTLTLHIEDVDGGKATKGINYLVQGVMPLVTYDLWIATATFEATVINTTASSVKIAYSANGGEWQEVVAQAGANGMYTATITNLSPATNYSYKLVIDGADAGKGLAIATAAGAQIPNGDMENWSEDATGIIVPFAAGEPEFWLTGNKGAAMANAVLTQASNDVRPGSTGVRSAHLKSQKASVMGIGKFAAGNLFTGTFALNGMDGIVTFGRDFTFTAKPKSLSFWMKNNEGTIDEGSHASGTDIYTVMVIITDGTTFAVNTKDTSSFLVLDELKNKDGVIAWGYITGTDSRADWTEETINLTYRPGMESAKPKKLIVSFTPSGYGDYFCGSTSSWMYVDDIKFNY